MTDTNRQITVTEPNAEGMQPRPLDIPRTFKGYDTARVEEMVAAYETRLTRLASANLQLERNLSAANVQATAATDRVSQVERQLTELTREAGMLRDGNAKLTERADALAKQAEQWRHRAENPFEALGSTAQGILNDAKEQAETIRTNALESKARADAEAGRTVDAARQAAQKTIADANAQAEKLLSDAKTTAMKTIADAKAEAERMLQDAKTRAERLQDDSEKAATVVLKEADAKASGMIADAEARVKEAAARESDAVERVADAKRLLQDALGSLS